MKDFRSQKICLHHNDAPVQTLERLWRVHADLPEAHVAGNKNLRIIYLYDEKEPSSIGDYGPGNSTLTLNLNADLERKEDDRVVAEEADVMYGENAVNRVIRHETGHSVDQSIGGSDAYCLGLDKTDGGAWVEYKTFDELVDYLIATSNGPVHKSPLRDKIADFIKQTRGSRLALGLLREVFVSDIGDEIKLISGMKLSEAKSRLEFEEQYAIKQTRTSMLGGRPGSRAEREVLAQDPLFDVLSKNDEFAWQQDGGGVSVGGRIFQRSSPNPNHVWTSYLASARNKKVSKYQFRSRRKHWAELYAAYYATSIRG